MTKKPAKDGLSRRRALEIFAALPVAVQASLTDAIAARDVTGIAPHDTDYRALICVYMNGGNDHGNTLVPLDENEYKKYRKIRRHIAIDRAALQGIHPANGGHFGLHPDLKNVAGLFRDNAALAVANVGALHVPVSLENWKAKSVPLPLQLFSHTDQSTAWYSALPRSISRTGWLGRLADIIDPVWNDGAAMPGIYSTGGPFLLHQGKSVRGYSLTRPRAPFVMAGARLNGSPLAAQTTLNLMQSTTSKSILKQQVAQTNERAFRYTDILQEVFDAAPISLSDFPKGSFGTQLFTVAAIMAIAPLLRHKRQIFVVSVGGFDLHANQLERQAALLKDFDGAVGAFSNSLRALNIWDKATVFTGTDFGRSFIPNGTGTDHGWGGHQFVLGGSVNGGRLLGDMPEAAIGTKDDAGNGRLIPSLSLDQYVRDLCVWIGCTPDRLDTVLPNAAHFDDQRFNMVQA